MIVTLYDAVLKETPFLSVLGAFTEKILEEERERMRRDHEQEITVLKSKMESEKQTKAAMQSEIESMKKDYEEKLKQLEETVINEKSQTDFSMVHGTANGSKVPVLHRSHSVLDEEGNVVRVAANGIVNGGEASKVHRKSISQMQQEAMLK